VEIQEETKMENVMTSAVVGLLLRLIVMGYFSKANGAKSEYWSVSVYVGIFGILAFVFTEGVHFEEGVNIGTALGFFGVDILIGLKQKTEKLAKKQKEELKRYKGK
jgi:hypothetical protein